MIFRTIFWEKSEILCKKIDFIRRVVTRICLFLLETMLRITLFSKQRGTIENKSVHFIVSLCFSFLLCIPLTVYKIAIDWKNEFHFVSSFARLMILSSTSVKFCTKFTSKPLYSKYLRTTSNMMVGRALPTWMKL